MPHLWDTDHDARGLLQLVWTKSHLTIQQHEVEFGKANHWAWTANDAADRICKHKSAGVFSHQQAQHTAAIDSATSSLCAWLGQRCVHILVHDKVPKATDCKFEAAPVKRDHVKQSGPNKRQKLLAATGICDPSIGHSWVISSNADPLHKSTLNFIPLNPPHQTRAPNPNPS